MAAIHFYRTDRTGTPRLQVKVQSGTDEAVKARMQTAIARTRRTGVPLSIQRTNGGLTIQFPGFLYVATYNGDGHRNDWLINADGSPADIAGWR